MPAFNLPPPPVRGQAGDFVWTAWQNNLYKSLSNPASITWTTVDKAGSSIADLANHDHALLTNQLGTGSYHMSSTEAARVTAAMSITSAAADPTTTNITAGNWALYKNTTSGLLKLWANDGGTMKSVLLA
jgi:hypothetical protein